MRAIYYDTETTGTNPEQDRIIEIAAHDPVTGESFSQLIHPGCPIPPEATVIHHITDDMVASSPPFAEVAPLFSAFCGTDCVLIAHNNDAFDRRFLENEWRRCSLALPLWVYVDSLKWSRKYRPDLPRHTLQFLREVYNIPPNEAHRALNDVMTLYNVFSKMIDDLSMQQVIALLNTTQQIERMPFGKYQGKLLSEIPGSYIRWLQQSGALDKPENKELKQALDKLST